VKRKFKQWWSISTKQTTATITSSHWTQKKITTYSDGNWGLDL